MDCAVRINSRYKVVGVSFFCPNLFVCYSISLFFPRCLTDSMWQTILCAKEKTTAIPLKGQNSQRISQHCETHSEQNRIATHTKRETRSFKTESMGIKRPRQVIFFKSLEGIAEREQSCKLIQLMELGCREMELFGLGVLYYLHSGIGSSEKVPGWLLKDKEIPSSGVALDSLFLHSSQQ